jgi:signal peptidase I
MTDAAEKRTFRDWAKAEAKDWLGTLAWMVPVYLAFTTVAFAEYNIPSESMVPSLEVGDRIVVNKFAYGYSRESLPFDIGRFLPDRNSRLLERLPKRGDVVVFRHPAKSEVLVKRLIGLPGDLVEVRNGRLILNNQPVGLKNDRIILRHAFEMGPERALRREETLPGGVVHPIHEFSDAGPADNWGPYRVPPGYLFMMGDNRDNSADSRFPSLGPIPIENLIGRAETVLFTTNFCNRSEPYDCPQPRIFKPFSHKASAPSPATEG